MSISSDQQTSLLLSAPFHPPPGVYDRNQSALRALQPEIAALLEAEPVPGDVTLVRARDGTLTYRLLDSSTGRSVWLGGTSMPSVSAPEMFATVELGDANVILSGIMSGWEVHVLAKRLPSCRAIFVIEQSLLCLKLVLTLHDYSPLFATGRLVILHGPIEQALTAFFAKYPGYLMPTRLLRGTGQSSCELAALQTELELAARPMNALQGQRLGQVASVLQRHSPRTFAEAPSVFITGTDASPASFDYADKLRAALSGMGVRCRAFLPDAPGKCHILARIHEIQTFTPDCVLLVNSPPAVLRDLLPPGQPTVSVWSPAVVPDSLPQIQGHFWAVPIEIWDPRLHPSRPDLFPWPPAADPLISEIAARIETRNSHCDVAFFFDLPPREPAAHAVTLPSHVDFWHALWYVVRQKPKRPSTSPAELVRDAGRASGIEIRDPKLLGHFTCLVEHVIRPVARVETAIQTVLQNGLTVQVWGRNWPNTTAGYKGPIPTGSEFVHAARQAHAVVIPELNPSSLPVALNVFAAGGLLFCQTPDDPFESRYPMLAELKGYLHVYSSPAELVKNLKQTISDPSHAQQEVAAAQTIIRSRHELTHRLSALIDHIRTHLPSDTPQN